jgi:hypothetical protein
MIKHPSEAVCAALLLAGASLVAASCGGAALEFAEPAAKSAEAAAPNTVEAAVAALDRAEAQLGQALGPMAGYAPAPAASVAPMSPPQGALAPAQPAPPPPPPTVAQGTKAGRAADGEAQAATPCTTACAALASMERAAEHLCTLAGAADGRCTSARERVKNATTRVRAACPACAK